MMMRFVMFFDRVFTVRLSFKQGFGLIELLTMIALLGVTSIALYALMNNMNAQSERLRLAAHLTDMTEQAHHFLHIAAQRAGYYRAGQPAITRSQAVRIPAIDHIQFCGENPAGQLILTEFRLSPRPENIFVQHIGSLQQRISRTNCVVDTQENWEVLTDNVFSAIEFRMASTIPPTPPSAMLDVKLKLRQIIPGTDEAVELTRRYLLSLYALIGLN